MTIIRKIRRANFKKFKYGEGLYDLLPRTMKNKQPDENIFNQTVVSMQSKIKDGEVNHYSHSITMDSDSRTIGIDNRCTACILHTTEAFVGELVDSTRRIKGFGGTISPLTRNEPYSGNMSMKQEQNTSYLSLTHIMSHQEKAD